MQTQENDTLNQIRPGSFVIKATEREQQENKTQFNISGHTAGWPATVVCGVNLRDIMLECHEFYK